MELATRREVSIDGRFSLIIMIVIIVVCSKIYDGWPIEA
jgi:hypothetical protein